MLSRIGYEKMAISGRLGTHRSFGSDSASSSKVTALHSYHQERLGAKMCEFAGYSMPVLYSGVVGGHGGVMKEHLHTRSSCGVFDVSHMGQVHLRGKGAAPFLERMTVVDTQALAHGKGSLSLLMNEQGGIKDDCIVTKVSDDHFYVVLNAGCKDKDMEHMNNYIGDFKDCSLEYHSEDERSLIAI